MKRRIVACILSLAMIVTQIPANAAVEVYAQEVNEDIIAEWMDTDENTSVMDEAIVEVTDESSEIDDMANVDEMDLIEESDEQMEAGVELLDLSGLQGDGSVDNPYVISTADDLAAFRDYVNTADSADAVARTACATLTADIDLGGVEWTPISTQTTVANQYGGTFDGDGYAITGLSINSESANQGLFASANGATIKKLCVTGNVTSTRSYIGLIVGKVQAGTTIEQCCTHGTVSTTNSSGYAGGIVGGINTAGSVISQCFNEAGISGYCTGGILGYSTKNQTISDCYNTGSIQGSYRAGGIVGQLTAGTIANCFNIGTVTGDNSIGGIYSFSNIEVSNSYYTTPDPVNLGGTGTDGTKVETVEDLAETLGEAFESGEEHPVLTWEGRGAAPAAKATVNFTVDPSDAALTVDGKAVNNGSVKLEAGEHSYAATKAGYSDAAGTFTVTEEQASGSDPVEVTVTLTEKVVSSLTISGNQDSYFVGDELAITVTAVFEDGSEADVTSLAEVTGFDSSAAADSITVTASYKGATASFTAAVVAIQGVLGTLAGKMNVVLIDGSYGFVEDTDNEWLASNNKGVGSSSATMTLTAVAAGQFSFEYKISSELRYDWLQIKINGKAISTVKADWSGSIDWKTYSVLVNNGDVITISYTKDSSGNSGDDTLWLRNFALLPAFNVTISSTPSDAEIVLKNSTDQVITAADGIYTVIPGTYTYEVSAFGYEPQEGTITVSDDDVAETVVLVKKTTKKVSFDITLPTGTEGAASVTLKQGDTVITAEADGSFNVPAGEYTYTVSHPQCFSASDTVTVADEDVTVPVELAYKESILDALDGKVAYDLKPYTYGFEEDFDNHRLVSTNKGFPSSSATMTFTALGAGQFSFDYSISSELRYDWLDIQINGSSISSDKSAWSGEIDGESYAVSLNEGDVVSVIYSKDSSGDRNDDCVWIKNLAFLPLYNVTLSANPEGASIVLKDSKGQDVSGDGIYTLIPGTYSYEVSALGFVTKTGTITVVDQDVEEDVTLERAACYQVTFDVSVPENAIGEYAVVLKLGTVTAPVEEDGSYMVPAGEYTYSVTHPQCAEVTGTVTVTDEAVTVPISMVRLPQFEDLFTQPELLAAENDANKPCTAVADSEGNYIRYNLATYESAAIKLTAQESQELSFKYKTTYSSYAGDSYKLTIKVNNTTVKILDSAVIWTEVKIDAAKNDVIELCYSQQYNPQDVFLKDFTSKVRYDVTFTATDSQSSETVSPVITVSCDGTDYPVSDGTAALFPGEYSYSAALFGYGTVNGTFTVSDQAFEIPIAFTKVPTAALTVNAPEGAAVTVTHAIAGEMTAEEGVYTLPVGEGVKVEVSKTDYITKTFTVTLTENKEVTVELEYAGAAWDGETATEPSCVEEYYQISNAAELEWFRNYVANTDQAAKAELTANINLNNKAWSGIGGYSTEKQFNGILDGQGYSVNGVTSTPLIYYAGADSIVRNVCVNLNFSGSSISAGIAAQTFGRIENCIINGSITNTGSSPTGGIAGRAYAGSVITGCVNNADIKSTCTYYNSALNMGGIVGQAYGEVLYCYNTGSISADKTRTSNYNFGGIAGSLESDGIVKSCYFTGTIDTPENGVGAIVGNAAGTITACYYLTGTDANASRKTAEEMKAESFVIMLNEASDSYNYDADGINNGFPVLAWQGGTIVLDPDTQDVAVAIGEITVPETVKPGDTLILPSEGSLGTAISWASDSELITSSGEVTFPEEGTAAVKLTATVSKNGRSDSKDFTVVVYSTREVTKEELNSIVNAFGIGGIWASNIANPEEETVVEVIERVAAEKEIDLEGVTVAFVEAGEKAYPTASVDDTQNIKADGSIEFFKGVDGSNSYKYAQYNNVKFTLSKDDVEVPMTVRMFIGWDYEHVYELLVSEAQSITWEQIRGENTDAALPEDYDYEGEDFYDDVIEGYVEQDLILPSQVGACTVEWFQLDGDDNVTFEEKYDSVKGKYYAAHIKKPAYEDGTAQIGAMLTYNLLNDGEDHFLNEENEEIPYVFAYRSFLFTVPFDPDASVIDPEETQRALEEGYEALIRDFVNKEQTVDTAAVADDLQMPAPKKLEEAGIFTDRDNEKVIMTSANEDILSFYGYHAIIYRPLPGQPDANVAYTVTIKDRNNDKLLAEHTFTMTVKAFTEEELAKAEQVMTLVTTDEVYWNGIKGENTAKDNVTGDLKPFAEILVNDKDEISYVRGAVNITFGGIDVDDLPGYDAMNAQPWREFRSSRESIVTCEQLLVTQPEYNADVVIDSVFTYTKYAKYYEKFIDDPAYARFAQFYKQPVRAEITVSGTTGQYDPEEKQNIEAMVYVTGKDSFVSVAEDTVSFKNNKDWTAWDALQVVFEKYGMTYTGSGNYVESVTDANGITLAPTEGGSDGWMFAVNCEMGGEPLAQTVLKDGDVIHFFFTEDYVNADGHLYVTDAATEATCTEDGLTEGMHCSICGEIVTAQAIVPAKGHTLKTEVTKATTTKDGKSVTTCSVCGKNISEQVIPYPKTITLEYTKTVYSGKAKKPTVTIKGSNKKAVSTSQYSVTYKNNKAIGKASVVITFKGNYTGKVTKTFVINPKPTSIVSLKNVSKRKLTLTWKKRSGTGYQIQYSTKKNFSGKKTVTIKKNSTVSKTIKSLTKGKTYYVRIRVYKTVSGRKYYSSWCSVKRAVIKK